MIIASDAQQSTGSKIRHLHQKILSDHQKAWYQRITPRDDLPENKDYSAELIPILQRLNSRSTSLIHDPLLNFFLPLWKSCAKDLVILFYYSEPVECALALQKQWRFPINFGLALWENYIIAACRNLANQGCIPVSTSKLRVSPKSHLASICCSLNRETAGQIQIGIDQQKKLLPVFADQSCESGQKQEFLRKSQEDIYIALEIGNFADIGERSLSSQSVDILDHYGQLRAGFEWEKAQNDMKNKHPTNAAVHSKPVSSTTTLSVPESLVDDSSLGTATVYIQGMEPLQFLAEPDSPVIENLGRCLLQDHNELVFLNYEGEGKETLYFMSADLLAIESNHSGQQ